MSEVAGRFDGWFEAWLFPFALATAMATAAPTATVANAPPTMNSTLRRLLRVSEASAIAAQSGFRPER
jgi:hypothetical protein